MVTLDAEGLSLTSILRFQASTLVVRLAKAPLPSLPQLPSLQEASFPGYRPKSSSAWSVTAEQGANPAVEISHTFAWGMNAAAESQSIHGVYVTWPADAADQCVIAFASFDAPIPMADVGDGLLLRINLQAVDAEIDGVRGAVVLPFIQVLSWKGGIKLFALSGDDRSLLRTLQSSLESALKRDTILVDLSSRSQRSRLPLVPREDEELLRAVTLLRARLQVLLGA